MTDVALSNRPNSTGRLLDATASIVLGQTSVFLAPAVMGAEILQAGLTETAAAGLASAELLINSIVCLACARYVNRWPWPTLFRYGGLGVVAGSFLSAFCTNPAALIAARLLVAAAGGICAATGGAILGVCEEPQRAANRSFALLCLLFALILAVLPWVSTRWGPSAQFTAIGVMCTGLLLSRTFFIVDSRTSAVSSMPPPLPYRGWPVFAFFLTVVLVWTIMGGSYSLSERVGIRIGLSEPTVGAVLSGVNIMGMLACAIAGMIDERLGRTRPLILSTLFMGIACVASMCTVTPWIYVAAILVFGASNLLVTTYSLALSAFMDHSGRLSASFMGFIALPYSLGPLMFAWLTDLGGSTLLGFAIAASTLLALPIQIFLIRRASLSALPVSRAQQLPQT